MTVRVYTDRSRYEGAQRCKRARWYGYHESGRGLQSTRMPLPLAVGLSVHVGLEALLRQSMGIPLAELSFELTEIHAVQDALADFAQYSSALDIGSTELAAMVKPSTSIPEESLTEQLARSLGMPADDPMLADLNQIVGQNARQFDKYLAAEQIALVEAMVRAYARRRLRPLLERYEVLEVEREGQWLLWDGKGEDELGEYQSSYELWFMSRPDALLRERDSNQLYLLSYKTTGAWDVRKSRDAEHDMQGLSEGIEIERRLGEWWQQCHSGMPYFKIVEQQVETSQQPMSQPIAKFLRSCDSPPRILAVRYEYLLKGERWTDKDLTRDLQMECRSQRSPLIRGYYNAGMTDADEQWNISWDYVKDTGEPSKLYWKNWRSKPVWESMPVKRWIDMLDETAMTVNAETGTERGYSSPAQATGYLTEHPLDAQFVPPVIVYRNDDDLRDLVEQLESQERTIAEGVAAVNAAGDEAERRHQLNVHFPQTRRACEYPTTCAFVHVCYGGEDIRRDPLGSGKYKPREVNHPQELEH